ncbi:hypothetical protein C8R44DRAFT_754341 [Mycena epipterygia]|nr:hypothetical protein C8R44DRAFT_754341 [Mycena epipterygia]
MSASGILCSVSMFSLLMLHFAWWMINLLEVVVVDVEVLLQKRLGDIPEAVKKTRTQATYCEVNLQQILSDYKAGDTVDVTPLLTAMESGALKDQEHALAVSVSTTPLECQEQLKIYHLNVLPNPKKGKCPNLFNLKGKLFFLQCFKNTVNGDIELLVDEEPKPQDELGDLQEQLMQDIADAIIVLDT